MEIEHASCRYHMRTLGPTSSSESKFASGCVCDPCCERECRCSAEPHVPIAARILVMAKVVATPSRRTHRGANPRDGRRSLPLRATPIRYGASRLDGIPLATDASLRRANDGEWSDSERRISGLGAASPGRVEFRILVVPSWVTTRVARAPVSSVVDLRGGEIVPLIHRRTGTVGSQ
jgi:hypothetical protein